MRYFEIREALPETGGWFLSKLYDGANREIESRWFTCGEMHERRGEAWQLHLIDQTVVEIVPPLRYLIEGEGPPLDFTLAAWNVPVVTTQVAQMLVGVAGNDIQTIPVAIGPFIDKHMIVNVVRTIECIDRERSVIDWYPDDEKNPDLAGTPFAIGKLVIDPRRVADCHIFRLHEYPVKVLVSDTVKQMFEEARITGITFVDVSGPDEVVGDLTADLGKLSRATETDYRSFYESLFSPIEAMIGPIDLETIGAVIGFDMGGPLSFCTIGASNHSSMITYVSCELAVREEQKPSSIGRYELLCTCDDQAWVRTIVSRIGRASLETVFGPNHTLDIGALVGPEDPIQGVLLEQVCTVEIDQRQFSILRVIGITRPELEFALKSGIANLRDCLTDAGVYPNTIVNRASVV